MLIHVLDTCYNIILSTKHIYIAILGMYVMIILLDLMVLDLMVYDIRSLYFYCIENVID